MDKDIIPDRSSRSPSSWATRPGRSSGPTRPGKTWRDTLRELKDGALAAIGPFGDVAGGDRAHARRRRSSSYPAIKAATVGMNLFKLALIGTGIGAIIVAIGALIAVYITFKDEIDAFLLGAWRRMVTAFQGLTGIARAVYEGIKTWMVDRFLGAVNKIKGGVDSVVGFFSSMKDRIVGNSIVPDMVDGVLGEFRRMSTGMETESSEGGQGVISGFFGKLTGEDGGFLAKAGGFLKNIQGGWRSMLSTGLNMIPVVGPLLAAFQGAIMAGMKKFFGWLGGFIKRGVAAIKNFFTGSGVGQPSYQQPTGGVAPSEITGLQGGGHASAGRPYMVGEGGPELFVPSQSGSVLPNNIAAAIGAEVAKALRAHPPTVVVPPDEVTDAVLYRMDEREAIRQFRANTV